MRAAIRIAARMSLAITAFWFTAAALHAQMQSQPGNTAVDPASLPAHDSHQRIVIGAEPYTSGDRYKEKFGKHTPYEGGIAAVEVFARNDNDLPVRINLNTIQLLVAVPGGSRQRLDMLTPEDVADRVLAKPRDPSPRMPIPRIGAPSPKRDKAWEEFVAALRSAALNTDLLPPHMTTHGFVYFDIARHYEWLSNSRLEIPDLAFMNDTKPIFFFEIDLAPAVHSITGSARRFARFLAVS